MTGRDASDADRASENAEMIGALAASWGLGLAIVVLGVVLQALGHIDGDVSWFVTFAEKVFDGARAYVDVSDPNPPAGFLVYMPAIFLERGLGFHAEAVVVCEVLIATALSLALSRAIVRRAGGVAAPEWGVWRNAALWILLVAAGFGFAEREHFALIACLPFLAVFCARAEGRPVAGVLAVLAGLGGGLTLAFKVYFVLPLAAAALVACLRQRSLKPAFGVEVLACGATFLAYLAMVWFRYPDYFAHVLPLAIDVYAPARNGLGLVLASPPFLFNAVLLLAIAASLRRLGGDGRVMVLAAASAGFLATYVLQAKIWFNHAYPGIALAVLAAVVLATRRWSADPEGAARFSRLCVLPALICAPFFSAVQINATGAEEYKGLAAAIAAQAPPHPKIVAIAEQLDVGFPATRHVGGVWVARSNALWVNNCVRQILGVTKVDPDRREKLEAYAAAERRQFAEDIAAHKPDIVLMESKALRLWAQAKPETAHVLDGYSLASEVGDIEIWSPRIKNSHEGTN